MLCLLFYAICVIIFICVLYYFAYFFVGVRGFPLRPIPSLGAMGPGPGHLGKFFSARRRRRRRRRRRPWGLFFKNTKIAFLSEKQVK